ncbi:MAG: DNA cytosine methyltransferase [Clostridiales bacterium]|nr:DNA cytosine methyltransferase [Clostridiales bacterium]
MMKVASFFAGVGGIDVGFEKAGFKVIWANEYDKHAASTYKLNFNNELIVDDIKNVNTNDIPDFDVMLAGFPCQAFSVAGYRKGFEDERGNLFFELERVFKEKKPQIIFLENVKNLVGHDNGNTFRVILDSLKSAGYHVKKEVLNACDYGNLPQNRERIYIVAFLDEKVYKEFEFPEPIELTHTLRDYIDYDIKQDDKYYYTADNCGFYDELKDKVKNPDTTYQWRRVYVRENKSNLCPTLTANMGTGGHNVPIIYSSTGIRKFTPRECFNIMGFDKDYKLPSNMANTHLYKQAGNSVVVPVIERIAKEIKNAIERARTSYVRKMVV